MTLHDTLQTKIDTTKFIVLNVSKKFFSLMNRTEVTVLRNISLEIEPGKVTALMGNNGSGKSTLLRLMAGLIKPSKGTIYIKGINSRNAGIKNLIGFMPENPLFHRGISGIDFLTYLGKLKGIQDPRTKAKMYLEQFGIEKKWQILPINLYSEGMRERTGLAIAFMTDPPVLLLDEPLENLDSEMKITTIRLMGEAAKEHKKIVVIAVHHDSDLETSIDRKIYIKNGKIEE